MGGAFGTESESKILEARTFAASSDAGETTPAFITKDTFKRIKAELWRTEKAGEQELLREQLS